MKNVLTLLQPKEQEKKTFNRHFRSNIWEDFSISMFKLGVSLQYKGVVLKNFPGLHPQTPYYLLPTHLTMVGTATGGIVLQFCTRDSGVSRWPWAYSLEQYKEATYVSLCVKVMYEPKDFATIIVFIANNSFTCIYLFSPIQLSFITWIKYPKKAFSKKDQYHLWVFYVEIK